MCAARACNFICYALGYAENDSLNTTHAVFRLKKYSYIVCPSTPVQYLQLFISAGVHFLLHIMCGCIQIFPFAFVLDEALTSFIPIKCGADTSHILKKGH